MELIYTDSWGPTEVPSLGGAHHGVIFVDDKTRVKKIYPLKDKKASTVLSKLKRFKKLLGRPENLRIRRVRGDGGPEYEGEFAQYLEDEGIIPEMSAPYTQGQNGVAERSWRTLADMACTMIKHAGLDKSFWAEAMSYACFISNRLPTAALDDGIPYDKWRSLSSVRLQKNNSKKLLVFGCPAFVHVDKSRRRGKLSDKAKKMVFLGFDTRSKAYRLYNPATKRVVNSLHVTFDEAFDTKRTRKCQSPPESDSEDESTERDDSHDDQNSQSDDDQEADHKNSDDEQSDQSADDGDHQEQERERSNHSHRRSGRQRNKPPVIYQPPGGEEAAQMVVVLLSSVADEPNTYNQALKKSDRTQWIEAMSQEYQKLDALKTWSLVPRPPNKNVVGSRWVFKKKRKEDGSIALYKARMVAQGFKQIAGVDFLETFAPVARFTTIRVVLALAAMHDWELQQMDVDSAFPNASVEEEIYMEQPRGQIKGGLLPSGNPVMVMRLHKALYGLKQSGRNWNLHLHRFLESLGFKRSHEDHCLYTKINADGRLQVVVLVYVDDLIITGPSAGGIQQLKNDLAAKFKMKDLGNLSVFLGVKVVRDRSERTLTIQQCQYVTTMLNKFNMQDCKPMKTPAEMNQHLSKDMPSPLLSYLEQRTYRQAVGSLLYASIATRPDLATAVREVSRFMQAPRQAHWTAVKRIFRYLQATRSMGISFAGDDRKDTALRGYADSDWGNNVDNSRSVSGYAFLIYNGVVSWRSKLQDTVATSTCEAEYVTVYFAGQEAIHLRRVLRTLHQSQLLPGPTPIHEDNAGCIKLAHNPVFHKRTKHIKIKYHFIRELITDGTVALPYIPTEEQIADIFTKPLGGIKFAKFRRQLGVQ
jgi:hypothetical protein